MFFTFFWPFLGKPCKKGQKSTKKVPKPCKNQHFVPFGAVHGFFPTGSRLVPGWFPDFQKVVLEFAESGVKFWPEICRIGWFLRIWEVFWWVWGGWGASLGVRGVVLGWLGWGFGGFGKVSGDFWWWFGKMRENFWGFGRFGKIWRGLEGFWRVEWFLVIFTAIWRLWWALGWFFIFRKVKCIAMLAKPTQSHVKHGRGTYTVPIIFSSLSLCVKLSCEYWW